MTKRLSTLVTGALLLSLAFSGQTMAQVDLKQLPAHPRGGPEEKTEAQVDLQKTYPAWAPAKMRYVRPDRLRAVPQTVKRTLKNARNTTPPSLLDAPAPMTLWGNVIYQNTWGEEETHYGFYSFSTAPPITALNLLGEDPTLIANGGSGVVDGVMHSVFLDMSLAMWGIVKAYHMQFDPENWQRIAPPTEIDLSLAAFETAQDQTTGEIYGAFYNSDLTKREFGVVDFENETRTTFGTTDKAYVALGLSTDGYLYGIATDGNLYKIDKTNGTETLIGSTGIELTDAEGSYYSQSGEIDQKTNTFYWASVDNAQQSALYTVDLATGAVTKISDFPNGDIVLALTVPKPLAEAGAPAAAEELSVAFNEASLSGKVNFKAPTKTYGGSTLTGELTYRVMLGKQILATGKTQPGANVSADVTVTKEGLTRFVVQLENAAGPGTYARIEKWIGYDEPKAIEDIKLTIDNATGAVNLTWQAPTSTIHDGYLGPLTYDVMRYPDSVKVVTNGSATQFAETLQKGEMIYYTYGVLAHNGTQQSVESMSNGVILGDTVSIPYLENFKTSESMNLFKIIDVNGDGKTWKWNPYASWDPGTSGQAAIYPYNRNADADDWMLTPPVHLKKGFLYHVAFKTKSRMEKFKERLEVKFGKGDKAEDMTDEILAPTDISSKDYITYEKDLKIDADGKYRIGFHALSPKNQFFLYIDSISIEKGVSFSAPDTVSNLTITPNPQAAKKATITFTTPTLDIAGKPLSGLFRYTVERKGKGVVKMVEYPARGKQYTFEDEVEENGFATYTIYCTNKDGDGRRLNKTVYVGLDVPKAPTNGRLTDQQSSIKIDWDAVEGVGKNGGIVLPENVIYQVYNIVYDKQGNPSAEILDDTKQTTYQVTRNTEEGNQEYILYALSATNDAGTSKLAATKGLVIGTPYALPIEESLPGGRLNLLWWIERSGSSSFAITTNKAYDNDGGAFVFNTKAAGDEASLNSGKISLKDTKHPQIALYHYSTPGKPIKLEVEVRKPDNTIVKVGQFDYATYTGQEGWQKMVCDLDANQFAKERYIQIGIHIIGGEINTPLWFDKISLRDLNERDLKASISAPEMMMKGETARTTISVENYGVEAINTYKVRLTAGNELVKEIASEQAIQSGEIREIAIDYKANVLIEGNSVALKAEVICDEDQNKADNVCEATVKLKDSEFPKPENVTAQAKGGTNVSLNWSAPSSTSQTITEDFEFYMPWSIDTFGDWTTIDADGGITGGFWRSYPYKHQGTPFAFIAFNPENLFTGCIEANPGIAPHSGDQYLAAVYTSNDDGTDFLDADNWLISPKLSGAAQKIDLWINNFKAKSKDYVEQIEILYSTTGRNKEDFQKIGDTHTISGGVFQNIAVDLPEGAKYFAIHHITDKDNVCLLMLDDVTFTKGYDAPKGYNVYRDGKLVIGLDGNTMKLDDSADTEGAHTYGITAVYEKGESQAVLINVTTALQLIEALSGQPIDIYTIDGRLIAKGLNSLPRLERGIYVINGQKVVIK